jgi:tetratricopeptide (TPR) repeat protein
MSVVNDVLKNLNQRQSMQGQSNSSENFFHDKSDYSKWLLSGLIFSVVLCCALIAFIVFDISKYMSKDSTDYVPLPDALFINSDKLSEDTKDSGAASVLLPANEFSEAGEYKNISSNSIVKRNSGSQATESVVSAINNGDIDGAKNKLSQASQRVQSEVKLRLLLKENPVSVLPEIKRQYPDFSSQPRLLALAAQGQQRSGDHQSAVDLYTQLIPLEPNESRWRTGLAISLETLGDTKSAKRLYQLALSMGTLPYSLKRFSESRLERIQN